MRHHVLGAIAAIAAAITIMGCSNTLEPTGGLGTFHYSLTEESHVRIVLKNSYDTVVAVPVDGVQPAGSHSFTIKPDGDFAEGIYYFFFYINGELIADTIIIILAG